MKWFDYSKTAYLRYRKMSAEDYAMRKMNVELLKCEMNLRKNTSSGRVSWCFFDRERFDKKLKKKIRGMFNKEVNLNNLWEKVIVKSNLYIQQDFLGDIYGYNFRLFGKFKDYGMVIFYTDTSVDNKNKGIEILEKWFYDVVITNYQKEREYYNKFSIFSKKTFEFEQRWGPVCDAIMYFDNDISIEKIEKYLMILTKIERLSIKTIDKYKVVFE